MFEIEKVGKPKEFWFYFGEISKIPRCSGNEERVRTYVKNEAQSMGYKTKIDKVGNLLVSINPNSSKRPIILQSHLDMVCTKNDGVIHDFTKDPIKLKLIKIDGKEYLTAEGTTMGADNGVGIAFQLFLMKLISEGREYFNDTPIDLLFTVDEEGSMFGAFQIDKTMVNGDYLINLDGFNESSVIIGNVGGSPINISMKIKPFEMGEQKVNFKSIKISITGLVGGHSALDIDKGRYNAIKLMGKLLRTLQEKKAIYLISIDGGDKMNAIPRESISRLFVEEEDYLEIKQIMQEQLELYKRESKGIESNLCIDIEDIAEDNLKPISKVDQQKLISFLCEVVNGPISLHPDFENLVYSSSNFSSINTKSNTIKMLFMPRSFEIGENEKVSMKMKQLLDTLKVKCSLNFYAGYGAWIPDMDSELLKITKETYKKLYNEEIKVNAIHATLETGIFRKIFPELQMISYGPNGYDAHSPDERLEIQSIEKACEFLIQLIKNLSIL